MADPTKYGKYIISDPKVECVAYHPTKKIVKGVTFPDEIFLDSDLVKESPMIIDIGWRFEVPDPDPVEWEHSHDFDEALCFIGTDPSNPSDLGGEIDRLVCLGGANGLDRIDDRCEDYGFGYHSRSAA